MRARRPSIVGGAGRCRATRFVLLALAGAWMLSSCSPLTYVQGNTYAYSKLSAAYHRVRLKSAGTLEVLSLLDSPDVRMDPNRGAQQFLSQSATEAALSGKSLDGLKIWVTLVAFEEYRMTASRKAFFCSDEEAVETADSQPGILIPPRAGIVFDAQFVLDPEVTTTPYVTDEARKMAIIRWFAERFHSDVRDLSVQNSRATGVTDLVATAGRMMNETFQGLLAELDKSPALVRDLDASKGVTFPHRSLNQGCARMTIEGDVAIVTVRVNLPMPPFSHR